MDVELLATGPAADVDDMAAKEEDGAAAPRRAAATLAPHGG